MLTAKCWKTPLLNPGQLNSVSKINLNSINWWYFWIIKIMFSLKVMIILLIPHGFSKNKNNHLELNLNLCYLRWQKRLSVSSSVEL